MFLTVFLITCFVSLFYFIPLPPIFHARLHRIVSIEKMCDAVAARCRCCALRMQAGSTCCEHPCCIAAILASSRSELKRKPFLSSEETLPLCELLKRQQEKAPVNFSGWWFSNYLGSVRWQAVHLGPVGEEEDDKVLFLQRFCCRGECGDRREVRSWGLLEPSLSCPLLTPMLLWADKHQAVPTNPVPWLEALTTSLQLSLRLVLFF